MLNGFFVGNKRLNSLPVKIVSLVPSQTELLFDLGLDKEVVGITKFCIHPKQWFDTKNRIGGTKNVAIQKVKELQPDLIIANKEENVKEQIEALSAIAPVWVSDIETLDDALDMIAQVGLFTKTESKAQEIIDHIRSGFQDLFFSDIDIKTAAYLIWRNPWMIAGSDTFINDLMNIAGMRNVFEALKRYPEITLEQLSINKPDLILLSSEPFPFQQMHVDELKKVVPESKILLVDGELFSWYGSRLRFTSDYFKKIRTQF